MGRWGIIGGVVAALGLSATVANAEVVWTGDFETGDLSQWNFVLNETVGPNTYASAQQAMVLEGQWAGYLELHDDAEWGNGLRRVELQHSPDPARTAEGAETWFAWSFYLPEALPQDPGHSIGYWESANSYQQMMAFNANGQNLRFITQQPNYVEHWNGDGVLTPGQWHRIAMRVLWSEDPMVGEVDVWFDGEQVVTAAPAKTLADSNPHFVQVGLLHGNQDLGFVTDIYIDNALEGDSLEDVDPEEDPGGTTGGPGDDDDDDATGPSDDTAGPGDDDDDDDDTAGPGDDDDDDDDDDGVASAGTTSGDGTGTDSGGATDDSESGCGCTSHDERSGGALLLLPLLLLRRRVRPERL